MKRFDPLITRFIRITLEGHELVVAAAVFDANTRWHPISAEATEIGICQFAVYSDDPDLPFTEQTALLAKHSDEVRAAFVQAAVTNP